MSYLTFEAVTSLSKKEVIERLENSLTELNWFGRPKDSRPFYGTVAKSDFKITRVVWGRDASNPVISGHVWSTQQRTHVNVQMALHPVVGAGLAIYSVLVGSALLMAVLDHSGNDAKSFFLMLLLPWLVGIPLFYYNASKSKKLLQERLTLIEVAQNGG